MGGLGKDKSWKRNDVLVYRKGEGRINLVMALVADGAQEIQVVQEVKDLQAIFGLKLLRRKESSLLLV